MILIPSRLIASDIYRWRSEDWPVFRSVRAFLFSVCDYEYAKTDPDPSAHPFIYNLQVLARVYEDFSCFPLVEVLFVLAFSS